MTNPHLNPNDGLVLRYGHPAVLIHVGEADGALRLYEEPPSGSSPTWRISTGSLEHGHARKVH